MGLAAGPAPDLGNAVPADTHDALGTLGRQIFLSFLRRQHMLLRLVKIDLAAAGTAVDLHFQRAGQNIPPISGEKAGLSQLELLPLQKLRLSAAVTTAYRSHWAFMTASMTPLTPAVSTVSMRPLS